MKQERKVFDTESFIVKAKDKFGDKFDYSRVDYKAAKIDVEVRCVKHDLWFKVQPYTHTNGKGSCPECRRESSGLYNKLSVEDFIRRSSEVHKGKYDYSLVTSYKNAHTKVTIICPEHGEFEQIPTNHLHNGYGCIECAARDRGLEGRLTKEDVIQRFVEKHGHLYDYSQVDYKGYSEPVKIYCKTHLLWFTQPPQLHLQGTGCVLCSNQKKSDGNLGKSRGGKTTEEFIESAIKVHGDKYDYRLVDYRGVSEYVKIVCKEHGLFIQHAGRHLDGRGCQKCGKIKASLNNRTPLDDFKSACVDQHNNFYDYSLVEYETLRDKVKIICPIHGVFLQKASDHIYGKICKKCTNGGGYNPDTSGYFYILKVTDDCIKFGITKNIENRLKTIRDYSVHDVTLMYSFKFEDGRIPPTIESDVKKLISCGILPKEEMYSGFTETTDIANLRIILDVVDKYKDQLS